MKISGNFKDKLVLISWVTGLLIIISVFWIITQSVQTRNLLRTVNNVFITRDDPRRVSSYIPRKTSKADIMGYWYKLYDSEDEFFVFTVIQDGILIPLGAVVSFGSVRDIVPLSAHAFVAYEKIPESILQMYIRRIEVNYTEGRR